MIKLLELFGGIGACTKAFKNLGIEYKVVDYVEIDRFAVASYNAINDTNFLPQDISKWDKNQNVDLIMHGSPCQDFSISGNNAGGDEGSGTRSSLMYETIRIVEKLKPKYVIWENVKNLLSKKHIHNFENYINKMNDIGYNSYYQVLNAKDYGIPQNRERIFTVSIRKDIKQAFVFPPKQELKIKLKDLLEDKVDEKYYLSEKMLNYCLGVNQDTGHYPRGERFLANINRCNQDVANTISTNSGQRPVDNFIKIKNGEITQEPFLKIKEATKKGYNKVYDGDSINLERINSKTRRVRVGKEIAQTILTQCEQGVVINDIKVLGNYSPSGHDASRKVDISGIAPTVKENHGTVTAVAIKGDIQLLGGIGQKKSNGGKQWYQQDRIYSDNMAISVTTAFNPYYQTDLKIRKLTPLECWRLMGFDDSDYIKASMVNSNTQLYKQAGNSIVVNVLEAILTNLLIDPINENEYIKAEVLKNTDIQQLTLFDYE